MLIVSDTAERLTQLSTSLKTDDIEVSCAASLEELGAVCRDPHDLVVIDVSPERLVGVLRQLRASDGYATIPVLVEASRIITAPGFAGVLPQYRAMPCGYGDLVMLTRRLASAARPPKTKRVL